MDNNGWSFIIVTDGLQGPRLKTVVESIVKEVPDSIRDIVIVGGYSIDKDLVDGYHVYFIPFDEKNNQGAICRKKNVGVANSLFKNVVVLHDYYVLNPQFITHVDSFGDEWDLMMVKIYNSDNKTRFRDWCNWNSPDLFPENVGWYQREKFQQGPVWTPGKPCLMPYDHPNPHYYISGGFYIGKKDFLMKHKLDENLRHMDAEDVEVSLRWRAAHARYRMNKFASVHTIKEKDLCIGEYND